MKGFTLVELIIAVVFLIICATILFKLFAWATWIFWAALVILVVIVAVVALTGNLDKMLNKLSEFMDQI